MKVGVVMGRESAATVHRFHTPSAHIAFIRPTNQPLTERHVKIITSQRRMKSERCALNGCGAMAIVDDGERDTAAAGACVRTRCAHRSEGERRGLGMLV